MGKRRSSHGCRIPRALEVPLLLLGDSGSHGTACFLLGQREVNSILGAIQLWHLVGGKGQQSFHLENTVVSQTVVSSPGWKAVGKEEASAGESCPLAATAEVATLLLAVSSRMASSSGVGRKALWAAADNVLFAPLSLLHGVQTVCPPDQFFASLPSANLLSCNVLAPGCFQT